MPRAFSRGAGASTGTLPDTGAFAFPVGAMRRPGSAAGVRAASAAAGHFVVQAPGQAFVMPPGQFVVPAPGHKAKGDQKDDHAVANLIRGFGHHCLLFTEERDCLKPGQKKSWEALLYPPESTPEEQKEILRRFLSLLQKGTIGTPPDEKERNAAKEARQAAKEALKAQKAQEREALKAQKAQEREALKAQEREERLAHMAREEERQARRDAREEERQTAFLKMAAAAMQQRGPLPPLQHPINITFPSRLLVNPEGGEESDGEESDVDAELEQ
jgi:hypothetical protein